MSKKSVIATAAILFLITSILTMINVEVVNANPFFIFHQVDPVPGTIPPIITTFSPQNNQEYYSDRIIISFNVNKPQLSTCETAITNVKYTLDNSTTQAFSIWRGGSASNGWAIPEFSTSFTASAFSNGNHNLTVYAEGVVYAGNMSIFFVNSSSKIFFNVGTQSLEPSPTSTTSSLIPTPIEVGGIDSITLSNSVLILAVIVVLTVCLAVGLLLKRKHEMKRWS